jgi:hypothetical protein
MLGNTSFLPIFPLAILSLMDPFRVLWTFHDNCMAQAAEIFYLVFLLSVCLGQLCLRSVATFIKCFAKFPNLYRISLCKLYPYFVKNVGSGRSVVTLERLTLCVTTSNLSLTRAVMQFNFQPSQRHSLRISVTFSCITYIYIYICVCV